MAFRMSDKEWEDIKKRSTGSYTTTEEEDKARKEEEAKLEDELDDEKMRKEQVKADSERRKSEREDRKFAKDNPGSDFAKQYNKLHPKKEKKQSVARKGRSVSRQPVDTGRSSNAVPNYKAPSFNIGKSGYTPLDYKPISSKPYYQPTHNTYYEDKPYKPIFGGKVPMSRAGKGKKKSKGRTSPITGFLTFLTGLLTF